MLKNSFIQQLLNLIVYRTLQVNQFSPGDIIEVEIQKGLTYLQIVSLHPSYPEVIRHIKGVYPSTPSDLEVMAKRQSRIIGMAPIAGLIEEGSVIGRKIGTANIPQNFRAFPTFQISIRDREGQFIYSWFWDGEGIWYDSNLASTNGQKFPKREVMTAKDRKSVV